MFGKMFEWFRVPVAEVPDDIAICEFECGKTECQVGDWLHCERRLRASTAKMQEGENCTH